MPAESQELKDDILDFLRMSEESVTSLFSDLNLEEEEAVEEPKNITYTKQDIWRAFGELWRQGRVLARDVGEASAHTTRKVTELDDTRMEDYWFRLSASSRRQLDEIDES